MPAKKRLAAPSPAAPLEPSSRACSALAVVGRVGKRRVSVWCLRVEMLTQYLVTQAVFGSRRGLVWPQWYLRADDWWRRLWLAVAGEGCCLLASVLDA
jgi:hypothetical protein